jgi:hypothetical protein
MRTVSPVSLLQFLTQRVKCARWQNHKSVLSLLSISGELKMELFEAPKSARQR